MYVGIANPRWRGKHSRHMRNPQFYVSGKRPISVWEICKKIERYLQASSNKSSTTMFKALKLARLRIQNTYTQSVFFSHLNGEGCWNSSTRTRRSQYASNQSRWWLGEQTTSHHLNKCWTILLTHICVTRHQWVKSWLLVRGRYKNS